jgi:hypothetical protein
LHRLLQSNDAHHYRIFGPKKNEEGSYEIRSNRELNALFNEPSIVATLKSQRIRCAGHVWRAKDQLLWTITKWKRPRQQWKNRVKEDIRTLGVMNVEKLAKHRETWREIVEATMGLNGPE